MVKEESGKQVSPMVSKICMLISAISMGNIGLLVSFLSDYPIYTIVLLRGLFGTFFLTFFMVRSHSFNKEFLKENFKAHKIPLIIIVIINSIVIYLYFLSITISGYSIAAFLLYTSGIFALLFLLITKMEEVSRINILSFILCIIGVALIMEFWTGAGLTVGLIVGILSGFTLGILVVCKKRIYIDRENNETLLSQKGNFDLFLAWAPISFMILFFLPLGGADLLRLTLPDLFIALLLGFFPTALAFSLYNVGIKNDKGGNIIIIAYVEPIMATINTIIFLRIFSVFTIIGGSLVLLANIIVLKYSKD